MFLQRPHQSQTLALALRTLIPFRPFSPSAVAAAVLLDAEPAPLDYLPGFPSPNPKHDELILAVPRSSSGKNISAKERKVGRVPSIVFEQENGQEGGNKKIISVQGKQIKKLVNHLGYSFFLSRLFQMWTTSRIFDCDGGGGGGGGGGGRRSPWWVDRPIPVRSGL